MPNTTMHSAIPKPAPSFYYAMVVWGEDYVDSMLDITIPCLLSPRNLPALSNLERSKFVIVTTARDAEKIRTHPVFKALERLIEVQFVDAAWIDSNIPYWLKAARGHRAAAEIANRADAYCIFLAPDFVISDGSMLRLEELACLGYEAVMVPGIRLVWEEIYEVFKARDLFKPGEPIRLTARELMKIGIDHIHEENETYNWDSKYFTDAPVVCTWNIPQEQGLLLRGFHLHPFMMSMRGQKEFSSLDRDTIDGDFLGHNVPDWDKIYVEQDSDNFLMFSLTQASDRKLALIERKSSIEALRERAFHPNVNPIHRMLFTKAVKLHVGDLNWRWRQMEESTGRMVYRILTYEAVVGTLQSFRSTVILRFLRERFKRRLVFEIKKLLHIRPKENAQTVWQIILPHAAYISLVNLQIRTGKTSISDVAVEAIERYENVMKREQSDEQL